MLQKYNTYMTNASYVFPDIQKGRQSKTDGLKRGIEPSKVLPSLFPKGAKPLVFPVTG